MWFWREPRTVSISWCLPLVNLGATSKKGEGFVWCCLVGAVDGDKVIGMHLLLLGDLCDGLWRGSNSRLRFKLRVAPQAIFDGENIPHDAELMADKSPYRQHECILTIWTQVAGDFQNIYGGWTKIIRVTRFSSHCPFKMNGNKLASFS